MENTRLFVVSEQDKTFGTMLKTTLILVPLFFGVVCGNRIMDNGLFRSSSLNSYTEPYNGVTDVDISSLNEKIEEDLKFKHLEKTSKPFNLLCTDDLDRYCNNNIIDLEKNPNNYLTDDSKDEDSVHKTNGLKPNQNVTELDDVLEVQSENNFNTGQTLQPNFNTFPIASYKDFYEDLIEETSKEEMSKRNGNFLAAAFGSRPFIKCDCKSGTELIDLGLHHIPRYLSTAICHSENSPSDSKPKCWNGSSCRPLKYRIQVLTFQPANDLKRNWDSKYVSVNAGCFCS